MTGGIFTVQLDFGAAVFSGPLRFLEISVRPAGSPNPYTVLSPGQPVTSTPYSVRSLNSSVADVLSSACVGCVTEGGEFGDGYCLLELDAQTAIAPPRSAFIKLSPSVASVSLGDEGENQNSLLIILFLVSVNAASAQTTAFTYQAKLTDGANPATGAYDMQFSTMRSWDSRSTLRCCLSLPTSFYLALLINTASLVLDVRLTAKCLPSGDKEKSDNN